jgi:hypothetical protein
MENYQQTIISEYANSPTLGQLIANVNTYIDPTVNLDAFYSFVWNVDTAKGYGLDVWGRIVGVDRVLTIDAGITYFGFNDGVADYAPFNQGTFWTGAPETQNYVLADDAFRVLILVKAAANIAETTTPSLNALLNSLFAGRGRCYVNDLGSMKLRYTFEFYLQPFEVALLAQSGALPRPSGVGLSLLQIPSGATFGFNEAGDAQPFNHGTFLNQGAITDVG